MNKCKHVFIADAGFSLKNLRLDERNIAGRHTNIKENVILYVSIVLQMLLKKNKNCT